MNSLFCLVVAGFLVVGAGAAPVGVFEGATDIGKPTREGSASFQGERYVIAAGGSNMWFSADAFHFVWRKVSGDVSLAADIEIPQSSGDPHRKGVLMVRQSLEAGAAYADAALHGDGLTSLQYRPERGARTYEIQANVTSATKPKRLRIEKRGSYVSMSIAPTCHALAGSSQRVSPAPITTSRRPIRRRARPIRFRRSCHSQLTSGCWSEG